MFLLIGVSGTGPKLGEIDLYLDMYRYRLLTRVTANIP